MAVNQTMKLIGQLDKVVSTVYPIRMRILAQSMVNMDRDYPGKDLEMHLPGCV